MTDVERSSISEKCDSLASPSGKAVVYLLDRPAFHLVIPPVFLDVTLFQDSPPAYEYDERAANRLVAPPINRHNLPLRFERARAQGGGRMMMMRGGLRYMNKQRFRPGSGNGPGWHLNAGSRGSQGSVGINPNNYVPDRPSCFSCGGGGGGGGRTSNTADGGGFVFPGDSGRRGGGGTGNGGVQIQRG